MYISNEELEKIKEYVDNLYWDQDRMSRDGRYFLNKLDNYIQKICKIFCIFIEIFEKSSIFDMLE